MQSPVTISIDIDAPVDRVWAELVDFASHTAWMKDAHRIRFEGEQREGAGTVLLIETRVGPLRTLDRFEITAVEPMRLVAGRHLGIFTGEGRFELAEIAPERVRLTWQEEIRFPWFFGGLAAAWVGRAILARIWQANLLNLKQLIERDSDL